MAPPVLAAHAWPTNAELIADVARLGYLRRSDRVLDPTCGRGVWWKLWQPDVLVTHDLTLDGVDFRSLPEADASFDAVAFDPPYVELGFEVVDRLEHIGKVRPQPKRTRKDGRPVVQQHARRNLSTLLVLRSPR